MDATAILMYELLTVPPPHTIFSRSPHLDVFLTQLIYQIVQVFITFKLPFNYHLFRCSRYIWCMSVAV